LSTTQREYYAGLERAGAALTASGASPTQRAEAVHATIATTPEQAACRAGCAHCCHFPVGVRFAEALRLAAAIGDDPGLRERLLTDADATRGAGWHQLAGRPCPLLHDDACRRYDARPTPCRALASFDAEACERSLEEPTVVPRDEASWWRGLGAAAALDDDLGPRELRSAVAAVLALDRDATRDELVAAFARARAVPGNGDPAP
jgi:Fe-S-cluster containining protein